MEEYEFSAEMTCNVEFNMVLSAACQRLEQAADLSDQGFDFFLIDFSDEGDPVACYMLTDDYEQLVRGSASSFEVGVPDELTETSDVVLNFEQNNPDYLIIFWRDRDQEYRERIDVNTFRELSTGYSDNDFDQGLLLEKLLSYSLVPLRLQGIY